MLNVRTSQDTIITVTAVIDLYRILHRASRPLLLFQSKRDGRAVPFVLNTDYNLDTTAKAVQKAVRTVTLIFFYTLSQYIKASKSFVILYFFHSFHILCLSKL